MEIDEYFETMKNGFEKANAIASEARAKGYDPKRFVEIRPAPDLASRVGGIIGVEEITKMIKDREGKGRQELAFDMVKQVCTGSEFASKQLEERLLLAVRVGLAILTEGIVVAPTEGIQAVEMHKNPDGSDYVSLVFAGPIRGAGGTGAAMSVALADYGRKLLGVGPYKAQQTEVERYLEEIQIYHSRIARLQYYPPEADTRTILSNCSVCVDGIASEKLEVNIHRNLKRLDKSGKEQPVTNKVRGGIGLVVCEGIAQKAKNVLKYTKAVDLDWGWLNSIIKVDKGPSQSKDDSKEKNNAVFLQELVAGRPVLSYPGKNGGFRLRYGRSRLTGIAAKGISPATMIILNDFIVTGTQLRIEKPGKGCVAAPVDSIEGPFVKLDTGEGLRINDAVLARELKGSVVRIISVGDILVTYGDFKKSNTPMQPTSYVEEYHAEQLIAAGYKGDQNTMPTFKEAFGLSEKFNVPMHPAYIYDYPDITQKELGELAETMALAEVEKSGDEVFDVSSMKMSKSPGVNLTEIMERLCIPHFEDASSITVKGDRAQSMLATLGFSDGVMLKRESKIRPVQDSEVLDTINEVAPFKVMRRAVRIGGRVGRPEKARERLMKPSPHVLFPVGEAGGKERSIYKAYKNEKRKFGGAGITVEVAKYRCVAGKEIVCHPYCKTHKSHAILELTCTSCGRVCRTETCPNCGGTAYAKDQRMININEMVESATSAMGVLELNKNTKGVKGLFNRDKVCEPLEKGVLRANNGVHIFKDGTSRFDATDMPMTHFYPKESMVAVERLRSIGYIKDYLGNELERDDQLLEMMHQDVVINRKCAEHFLNVARFVDQLLVKFYGMEPFYNIGSMEELVGHHVITLSPHTSAGVLGRIAGFTDANVGFAHPYVISARRRNCDGDEDTAMLLLDALINFSRSYLPTTIGGTMDAPLILTIAVQPGEVDDEVHEMEVTGSYGLDFYDRSFQRLPPSDMHVETVKSRLGGKEFSDLMFTHLSGVTSITRAPEKSIYTRLNSMREKIDAQFRLMDMLCSVDRPDTAKRLILSHFIPDLIGNMHSFSKQSFRCVACNAKYRRVPLVGRCTRCNGKIVLTISKGSIEKYLNMAIELANRYNLEPYIKQRLVLIREEIANVFGSGEGELAQPTRQFNLAKFM